MLETRSPILFVLSGPSGVGKDSLLQLLKHREPRIYFAITATTRPRRAGEIDGKSYHFVSRAVYNQMLDAGELLAPAQVHGNWYGAPLEEVRTGFGEGRDVMLKIDVQGAIQVRRRFPQAVFIFLAPSSLDDLVCRLRQRHTESPEELEIRIKDARFEMEQMPSYDYVVVNREENLAEAVSDVQCIVKAERLRTYRQSISLD